MRHLRWLLFVLVLLAISAPLCTEEEEVCVCDKLEGRFVCVEDPTEYCEP